MSKNLTRKGLALGALIGLASTVIAGTPANAANELTFTPSLGTVYAVPVTDTFTLTAGLPSGSTGDISQLKYKVSTAGALTVNAVSSVKLANATAVTSAVVGGPGDTAASAVSTGVQAITSAAAGYVSGTADVNTVNTTPTPNTYTHAYTAPTATSLNTLTLSLGSAATTSVTQTVSVTAFLDSNGNGTFDSASEWSTTQTVSFIKYSEITSSIAITAPIEGDASVVAKVQFTNINNEQLDPTHVGAYFQKGDGTALDGTPANVVKFNSVWSATSYFKYTATVSATGGLVKGSAVKVTALLKNGVVGTGDTASTAGAAQTATVTSRKVTTWYANTVTSFTAKAATAAATVAATDVALNKEYQVSFQAKDNSTVPVGVAGVAAAITVTTTATLSSTVTLTVNGTTYTDNTKLPGYNSGAVAALAATTGADGMVIVTIKGGGTTGLADGDDVVITAVAENYTATITTNNAALAYTSTYIENAPAVSGTLVAGTATTRVTTVDGTPVVLDVRVKDQFGGNAPDATYDVTATFNNALTGYANQGASSTTASTVATGTYAAVTGGKATLTILDNGTGTGVNTYSIDLRPKNANGVYGTAVPVLNVLQVAIVAAVDATAGAVTLTATAGGSELGTSSTTDLTYVLQSITSTVAGVYGSKTGYGAAAATSGTLAQLSTNAFGNYDSRNVTDVLPTETIDAQNTSSPVTVYGTVYSASTATHAGVPVANGKVTISAAGLEFKSAGTRTVYGDGTLVVYADANGRFSFTAASHLAGKQTVTITSGAGTSKIYLYFTTAAATSASTVAVKVADGASQFQAGRALDVVFTVTDKYGNPVSLPTTYAGNTDAKLVISQTGAGYLSLSGAQATGADGTFTSKLISNFGDLGTSTITATVDFYDATKTDLVKSVSSEFGLTDADVTVGGRAVYASVEFAKGKTVSVSVDGRRLYSKLQTTDNYTELKFTQKTAGKHVVTVRVSGGVVVTESVVTTK